MRISIRLHPCRSGTDLGLPVRCTLGIGAWDDSLAGLSHNQAARESGWKARLDAITRRKLGFPWVLGVIWRRWFTRLLLWDGEMFYLGVAVAKKRRSGTWKDIL
ncbi:hypothetical protein CDAR_296471 [Caerostris darwini]|uniref:Uncharacterized protein n=1 Tax=Caerostris darwini TaxID=1538125 RepID=A0AAV4PKF0_9ARAC|nr:hypothetical protein CDAR_296471 [Caerostris darwini]